MVRTSFPMALSLVDQVRYHLIERIMAGELRPGDRVASVRQIARDAQVSHATAAAAMHSLGDEGWIVNRVGSGARVAATPPRQMPPGLPPAGRAGTSRKSTAAALRRLHFLSCIEPEDYPSRYDFQVLCAIQEAAETEGWTVRLGLLQDAATVAAARHDPLAAGIVIGSNHAVSLQPLADSPVPVVYVGMSCESEHFASVSIDNVDGGRLATRYLLRRGHRRIRFVTAKVAPTPGSEWVVSAGHRHITMRHVGHGEVMAEAGLPLLPAFPWHIADPALVEQTRAVLAAVRDGHPDAVTALIVANDVMAAEVIDLALRMGLRVPQHLSVIGFENRPITLPGVPALTTLDFPKQAMGRETVELLANIARHGDDWPLRLLLPMRIRERDTVADVPTP